MQKCFLGVQRRNTFYTGSSLPIPYQLYYCCCCCHYYYYGGCRTFQVILGVHTEDKIYSWIIRNIY